jgi:hypothetical protein
VMIAGSSVCGSAPLLSVRSAGALSVHPPRKKKNAKKRTTAPAKIAVSVSVRETRDEDPPMRQRLGVNRDLFQKGVGLPNGSFDVARNQLRMTDGRNYRRHAKAYLLAGTGVFAGAGAMGVAVGTTGVPAELVETPGSVEVAAGAAMGVRRSCWTGESWPASVARTE